MKEKIWAQFDVIYLLFPQQFTDRMSNALSHGVCLWSNHADQREACWKSVSLSVVVDNRQ